MWIDMIKLGSNLSPEAILAKEKVKEFIKSFEPYFKSKLEQEYDYALTAHNNYSADSANFYNEIAIRGGKRIRGSLAYYVYKMLGGQNEQAALDLAQAIEMTHAFLLVLDDYTDKSQTRRGGPTAHIVAEKYFDKPQYKYNDPAHYGNAISLTASIGQAYRALEVISSLPVDPLIRVKLSRNLSSKIATTAYGQITDIFNSLVEHVPEKDVLHMLEMKTGVYTFENPVHSGALMAGATDNDLEFLSKYALPVGVAFQIHDDVIGMFGDSDYTGKSDKDDLMEGKMTLLIQHILANGTKEQIEIINKYLGNRDVTDDEHNKVKQALVDSGSYDYSEKIAKELVEKGKKALDDAPKNWDKDGVEFLKGVADYIIQRAH